MNIRSLILSVVAMLPMAAGAYDMVVTVKVKESGAKVVGLELFAVDKETMSVVGSGAENMADSTYRFSNLPDSPLAICYIVGGNMRGEEVDVPVDSMVMEVSRLNLPQQLQEVSVTASDRYITDEKTVFVPSRREKKIAQSGTMLLTAMAIPSLYVDPATNTIQTPAGGGVSAFINYLPASPQDLANLNPADVERVEVFDFPKDPRFNGAQHVVNYILVSYAYGGYTKLSASQGAVSQRGNYSVASKLTYGRMTYDVSGSYNYSLLRHTGADTDTRYGFTDGMVERTSTVADSRMRSNGWGGVARAVYQDKKIVISNTLSVTGNRMPYSRLSDMTSYSPEIYRSSQTESETSTRSVSPAWSGNYQFTLPHSLSLILTPGASYMSNTRNYAFLSDNISLMNIADESAWDYRLAATLQKRIGRQSVGVALTGAGDGNDIEYRGTTPSRMAERHYVGAISLIGNLSFGRWWLQGTVRFIADHTKINEAERTDYVPGFFIATGWNINTRHRLNLSSELSYWTIPMTKQGSSLQMTSDIEAVTGNPDLKLFRYNSVNLTYEWLPLKNLSFSFYSGFWRQSNPVVEIWEQMQSAHGPVMVRTYRNMGFINMATYGGAATLRLLDSKLSLRAGVQGASGCGHSDLRLRRDYVNGNVQAVYSLGQFYVIASYQSRNRSMGIRNLSSTPSIYYLQGGWGNGRINISLSALNMFRTNWRGSMNDVMAHNYESRSVSFAETYHRRFLLSVTYTFSYGKKIQRTQAPEAATSVSSGIIK